MQNGKTTNWSKWYLLTDKDRDGDPIWRIRRTRYVNGKLKTESYPAKKYAHLNSARNLEQLVDQLNHRHISALEKAEAAYKFKHTFITQELIDAFRTKLEADIPTRRYADNLFYGLQRHVLHWFINQLGKPDPIDWKRAESKWGLALRGDLDEIGEKFRIWDEPVHPDTIKKRIQIANRFLEFLHAELPEVVPPIRLNPISKAQMRLYKTAFDRDGEYVPGKYIPPEDWLTIEKSIDPSIKSLVQLGYYFGLRRCESLGVTQDDLYEDCLELERQIVSFTDGKPQYGPLKNRKTRRVEYWFYSPGKLYDSILTEADKMHPATYGQLFKSEMERLGFSYTLHDLRRSFITKAFRDGKAPRDIQLAVGHADLKTTLRYAQDDRGLLAKRKFRPKSA